MENLTKNTSKRIVKQLRSKIDHPDIKPLFSALKIKIYLHYSYLLTQSHYSANQILL